MNNRKYFFKGAVALTAALACLPAPSAFAGSHSLRCVIEPDRVAEVVARIRWRFQRGPIPPGR